MDDNMWPLVAVAITVVVASFGIPWILAEFFPWRSLWKQRNGRPTVTTESYKGRTALVSGANGAYGSRAAKLLAHHGIETLVLVDVVDCTGVKEEIESELAALKKTPPKILVWKVDMMSYESCRALGEKARELKSLDHVLLTAGISPEGWEAFLKSSPGNPAPPVLTTVTTFGVFPAGPTMWSVPKVGSYLKRLSNTQDGMAQRHQYGRSKALLLYFTRELAARVTAAAGKDGGGARGLRHKVTVNSADPGSAWTPLTSANQTMLIPRLIMNFSARDPQFGATALVNGASASEEGHGKIMMDFDTGAYPPFMERKSGQAAQKRVWFEMMSELTRKVPEVRPVFEMLEVE